MNYVIVYLVYSAIGLAAALYSVRAMRKYVADAELRSVAWAAFFLWPFFVVCVVALLIVDEFWPEK